MGEVHYTKTWEELDMTEENDAERRKAFFAKRAEGKLKPSKNTALLAELRERRRKLEEEET